MKIEWKKIALEDKMWMNSYYEYEQSNSCEVSFANNYLWAPFYNVEYAVIEDMLVFLTRLGKDAISMPMAKDDASASNLKKVIWLLENYFE